VSVITRFCDYYVETPDWFISKIQTKINERDLDGLTNARVQAINVTGEHPLVQLVGTLINPTGYTANFAGLLPTISVVESSEDEEYTTIGQGRRTTGTVDQAWVTGIRTSYADMVNRNRLGLVTERQLIAIETAVTGGAKVLVDIEEFMQRETVFVSLWCHNIEERKILGHMLRSVLYDLRKDMIAARLIDTKVTTSKGLVNFNFGKILYGEEVEITFVNTVRNYTVTNETLTDYEDADIVTAGHYRDYKGSEDQVDIYPKPI
jgi:hypothetical protein